MRRFLAARVGLAACVLLNVVLPMRLAGAQTWNDPRSRALAEGATQRRAAQFADTSLRDYQAVAHGYVAFLAQLGEGFRTPPKVIKTDELENEVYWRAPGQIKQRIVGRRDTLLLPTDIAYHTDHLGIVQNNFPDIIRIGDGGDEVADVPHPLSRAGLNEYDFALADSFSIGSGAQRIRVYEVKVRPKDDTRPRVVGAVYIDQASRQVVRLNLTFTRSAFLDKALEDLSLVLENRLVAGQYWLPSRQEIEIRRKGEWLDYPARGIIRGRWEIGDYRFNQELSPVVFTGPEIAFAPASVLAAHKWAGAILDSLPPDVRALSEPEIQRVQEEARALVRAKAMSTARSATLSGRRISDFARFNRVEGLSLGMGAQKQLGAGWQATARGRYGLDDQQGKGGLEISHLAVSGATFRLFASRDFRDVGDEQERSTVVNSLAAQEFASDYSDPYLVRALGTRFDYRTDNGFDVQLGASYEHDSRLSIHARPVTGQFFATAPVDDFRATRLELNFARPATPWLAGTELSVTGNARLVMQALERHTQRAFLKIGLEKPLGELRLITSASAAAADGELGRGSEAVFLGGPVSAPGYDFHSLMYRAGFTGHAELRMPAPFPAFSLGRYGRVPGRGAFSVYGHAAGGVTPYTCVSPGGGGTITNADRTCPYADSFSPSIGAAYLTPFDLVRIDVARGLAAHGRWMFYVDISREFWSIL